MFGTTQVNAMLLNEFLKEHRKNEEQQATIAQLKSTVAKQEAGAAKQEAAIALQQKEISKCSRQAFERAGSANPEGERTHQDKQRHAERGSK